MADELVTMQWFLFGTNPYLHVPPLDFAFLILECPKVTSRKRASKLL